MTTTKTASRHQALVFALVAALIAFLVAAAPQAAWAEEDSADTETTYVASAVVNGTTTSYTTLADAISNADSGTTVTLLADTTVSSKITISSTVTLDLNGKTLTLDNSSSGSDSAARLLYIGVNGSLTVKDSTATSSSSGTGSITNTGYSYGIFDVYGTLTIESGNFTDQGSGDGALIRGREGATVVISGGSFTVSYTDYGNYSGSYVQNYYGNFVLNATKCAVSITGGSYNVGQYCWGALKLDTCTSADTDSDTVTVSGVTITTYDSVGIECKLTDATISNCTIKVQNTSSIAGSPATAVGVNNQSVVTITSGTYSGPYAVYVYNTGGTVTIEGGTYTGTVAALISDADIYQNYYDSDGAAAEGTEGSTIIVTGGTINGAVVENESSQAVAESTTTLSGGTYSDSSATEFFDETSSYTSSTTTDEDGNTTTTYTLTADAYVAKIVTTDDDGNETTTYYSSLYKATSDAASGSTVTLLCDLDSTEDSSSFDYTFNNEAIIIIASKLTLDLNGYTLTFNNSYYSIYLSGTSADLTLTNGTILDTAKGDNCETISVCNGASLTTSNLTIKTTAPSSGTNYIIYSYTYAAGTQSVTLGEDTVLQSVESDDSTGSVMGVVIMGMGSSTDNSSGNSLTLNKATINVSSFGIVGNGSVHGTTISITDSTVTSTAASGIYHPQNGTLTIKDSTISGLNSGIEVRAGTVTITDSTISCTSTTNVLGTDVGSNGTTIYGAGIAISQHTSNLAISVTLTNCTVTGAAAVYEVDLYDDDTNNVTLSIVSGTYTATGTSIEVTGTDDTVTTTTTNVPAVYSENCTGFISGGYFSTVVDEAYCTSGYSPTTLVTVTSSDGSTSSCHTVAQGTISFWGGSLRADNYATESDDGTYTFSTDKADLRFGFCWDDLPDGATVKSFGWVWSTTESKVESATTYTVKGTGSRDADPTTYSYDQSSSGTVANLVITKIPTANFETTIYVKMFLTYEVTDDDGNTTSVTLVTDTYSRSVSYIATCIVNDSSAETSSMVYQYAQSVVNALKSDEE